MAIFTIYSFMRLSWSINRQSINYFILMPLIKLSGIYSALLEDELLVVPLSVPELLLVTSASSTLTRVKNLPVSIW